MPLPKLIPLKVRLRWVPNSMHLVQFTAWGRTFVVALTNITFLSPHTQAPLYLKGSVQVSMQDVALVPSEQHIFENLERTLGRDNILVRRTSPEPQEATELYLLA